MSVKIGLWIIMYLINHKHRRGRIKFLSTSTFLPKKQNINLYDS
ncbi:hypothetical protein MEC_00681 [Bartonella alsatica IBS 382]|uniref:Uncharacterized protein n=1 Tax=Bartonella alsatica IBS 382 TaxID=1094551 RepID=J1IVI7_9HYPH|nr:hypothetical protein MEC_00681 [Bartonella alsatica IBS 382]